MKRVRRTKIELRLVDLIARVDELSNLVEQQSSVLQSLAPKESAREKSEIVAQHQEPEYRPSSHQRSLNARSPADLERLAFGPRTGGGEPKVQMHPVKHPDLGSL